MVEAFELRLIEPGSAEYLEAREIRFDALYLGLNLPRSLIEDHDGRSYRHLVAVRDGRVVGYARLYLEDGESKVFQVSVAETVRGQGIATALMARLEAVATAEGRDEITLDAREHAVGFYERLGYAVEGEPFLSARTGTPHLFMRKRLG